MTQSPEDMTVNGVLVKVRLLRTNGAPLSEHQLIEILAQSVAGQSNSLHQDVVAKPLEPNQNIDSKTSTVPEPGPLFLHGFIVIGMHDNWPGDLWGGVRHSGQAFSSNDCSSGVKRGITDRIDEIAEASTKPVERLPIKRGRKVILLKVDSVDWISSGHNYVTLHASGESYRIRGTLDSLQLRLSAHKFARISRLAIVQIDRIKEFDVLASGDCQVTLLDGTKLTSGRRYRNSLQKKGLL